MTARQAAASEVLLDVDDQARTATRSIQPWCCDGATPRLIDEWQIEPTIWNHIRSHRGRPHQFRPVHPDWLCGTADDITRHAGAGRLTRLSMRPMSLFETGHSTGAISVAALLDGVPARSPSTEPSLRDLAERVSVGGWPGHIASELNLTQALRANRDYLDEVRRVDVARVDGAQRDPAKLGRLLRSFARNVATHAAVRTLATDRAARTPH